MAQQRDAAVTGVAAVIVYTCRLLLTGRCHCCVVVTIVAIIIMNYYFRLRMTFRTDVGEKLKCSLPGSVYTLQHIGCPST